MYENNKIQPYIHQDNFTDAHTHIISQCQAVYYCDVTWTAWRLKSPVTPFFILPFVQVHIKENIKAPRHWHLWGESTGTGGLPSQRASNAENVYIWHVIIVTEEYVSVDHMNPRIIDNG